MKLRCPVCHSSNSLEAYAADADGRELLILLAGTGPLFGPLVAYLGCFRPASRDLAHGRALRLAREVLELGADPRALAAALGETVEAMRQKRAEGDIRPLTSHRYLQKVLASVGAPPPGPLLNQEGVPDRAGVVESAPRGKRAQGITALEKWGNE